MAAYTILFLKPSVIYRHLHQLPVEHCQGFINDCHRASSLKTASKLLLGKMVDYSQIGLILTQSDLCDVSQISELTFHHDVEERSVIAQGFGINQ